MNDLYVGIYLAGLIAIVMGGLVFLRRKRKSSDYAKWDTRIGCLILFFLISPVCICVGNYVHTTQVRTPNEQRQIRADADKIIDALTQFKQSHGHYPEQLAELVPQYLETIPIHPLSWSYRYGVKNGVFFLNFDVPLTGLFFEAARWECNSKNQIPECWNMGD
ncbi:hypothetical protein TFLX_03517 [Thermoflexales bacterium]|nr:hypothetical protein TFLX_03517 [Thermoflexales bacterium]